MGLLSRKKEQKESVDVIFSNSKGNLKNKIYEGDYSKTEKLADGEEKPIFKDGSYGDYVGNNSKNPIVVGGCYKEGPLRGAEGIKAYIEKAESIIHPVSGWIIVDEVSEIKNPYKNCWIFKTKSENKPLVTGDIYYITKEDLKYCLKKVGFKNFKKIDDYKKLSKKMDKLFDLVMLRSAQSAKR